MPLYDFACSEGHRFERFVKMANFGEQQSCDCGAVASRIPSAPMVLSDTIEPRYGADGKLHDSLSSYRHSLTPEGNPKGERYFELGNDPLPEFKPKESTEESRRDSIKKAIADVKAGRVPPQPVTGIPA